MDSKAKLLIVDDTAAQRLALAAVLADLDVTLVEAASGRDALRCVLHDDFAVILLDVNMPGLDGFETAALLRQRRNSEHTPIIFVTAYSDDTHQARGYSLGAVDYILAPVEPDILRAKVSVFIDLFEKTEQLKQQREALRRYAVQLQQLSEASLAINSAQSVEDVVQILADNAAQIIGAHQANCCAALQDSATSFTATRVSDKYGGQRTVSSTPRNALSHSIHQPVRMTAAELGASLTCVASPREIIDGVPMCGWLVAPLPGRNGRTVGLAQLSEKLEGEFTAEDEGILVQLAQMGSIAIENILAAEAREANRLKDEFLGVLSHELRTPLQAMLTWTSILRKDGIAPEMTTRGLEVIERSARTQSQLIEDLLDVSRVIRGQLRLESDPVDVATVIELAIYALKPAAAAKDIQIGWTRPNAEHRIMGDAERLQQVVWNLLSNAVKFTPNGGRVEVQLTSQDGRVRIQVRDNGSGIPTGFLPHLFERFRQADSTKGRRHGGLGLGLAIVRHLVELHGGTVHADNATDGGAVFTILLPRAGESADKPIEQTPVMTTLSAEPLSVSRSLPSPPQTVPVPAPPMRNGVRLDGIRVVLVEDEDDARECLVTALQLFGADVVAVNSAVAAFAALQLNVPDVLLSDIAMPGQDGYALIRQVRAWEAERGGRLPAAALTAYVRPEDRADALLAGFDTHVNKPVQPLELARLVQRLAGRTDER